MKREVRELTEQAQSAMTSFKLFQVKKYTKHAAAKIATQVTLTELRNRRGQVHSHQVAAVLLDRKTEQSFNFKSNCFFCGTKVDFEEQMRRQVGVFKVTTLETKDTVTLPVLKGKTSGRKWYEPEYYMFMICQRPMLFIIRRAV